MRTSENKPTYLLNSGNCVDGEFLKGSLQLLIVRGGSSVDNLLLPASCALQDVKQMKGLVTFDFCKVQSKQERFRN